jgi:DNA-binding response OmpR family regulator
MIRNGQLTSTLGESRYSSVDPQTFGQLRILKIGDVELELDGYRAVIRGTPVHLPRKEFVILRQLMENAGRVLTWRELLDNAWSPDHTKKMRDGLVVHINRIRQRVGSCVDGPTPIRTVRNVGYVFDLPSSD